ncbi:MAG: S-layer homology domain-containing protein, partial [Oscillospiraceae bacterium]|nr:S-layer homology domain-containing protein [Oscillospiraceae bacterium]
MKKRVERLIASLLCLSLLSGIGFAAELQGAEAPTSEAGSSQGCVEIVEEDEDAFQSSELSSETEPKETVVEAELPEAEKGPVETEPVPPQTETLLPAGEAMAAEAGSAKGEPAQQDAQSDGKMKETSEPLEPPLTEMTDEQIIQKFRLTTLWSQKALIFAVRNGILRGVSPNDMAPTSNATQAQLSTILARILKTEKCVDLSGYSWAAANEWYYGDLQRTVSLGLFPIADPSAKSLQPDRNATREEVFVVLARVFGLKSSNRQVLYRFPDWAQVSDWAAEPLAAMIEHGFVNGSDGKLLPKANITREELAQVLYNLLSWIGTDLESGSYSGRLALAADSIPANTVINGDLLLSTDCKSIKLDHLTVTGRLIVQGNDLLQLYMKQCNIQELVICRPTEIVSDQSLNTVVSHAPVRLNTTAKTVQVFAACVILSGATAETVNMYQQGKM